MSNQLLTGSQNAATGTYIYPRGGAQGNSLSDGLHGSMYEAAYRGNLFHVTNQASVTTTVGLATTFTGLAIANPAGSGVNLVIRKFNVAQALAATTASAIGLMTGAGAAAGSLTVRNAKTGGAASATTTASAAATIATPILERVYASTGTAATSTASIEAGISIDIAGSLIITPGYYLATYTTGVISGVFTLVWEEVPV